MPEVCPENGLVVRCVDILVLVLDVGNADPVALSGAGHVAVHQLVHFLVRSAHMDNINLMNISYPYYILYISL